MKNRIAEAFGAVCATDEQRQTTTSYLHRELVKRQGRIPALPRYLLAGCAAALLLCLLGGFAVYQTPVSYISVDVNPSVELGLNRLDRVVSVAAYNEDGAAVAANLELKHKRYTQALELLLADQQFAQYLSGDAQLTFTVVSDREQQLVEGIRQCSGYAEYGAECRGATAQQMTEAHHNGLSFGKYQAFLELQQYDPTMTMEDCKQMTMREIRDRISACAGGQHDANQPGGHGNHGNGNGNGQGNGNGYRGGRG